jgi:iron-sulfur cluster assembly protein
MSTTTATARPKRDRPKAMRLSEAAAARIRDIIASGDGKVQGVRVGVTNGGCAGMNYTMDYAEAPQAFEEVVEDQGVKVFIDPKAIMFLIGTEMDFVREKLGSRFVFNNPNQTAACGCGESVTLKAAESN